MEFVQPFYIPASGAGACSVVEMNPGGNDVTMLELNVVSGGPVFLFSGRVDAVQAYKRTHDANVQFDLACAVGAYPSQREIPERFGTFTISSDSESIGYVRTRSRSK